MGTCTIYIRCKKSVDSVLYLCSHAEKLSMIDLRSEVNEIKRKFYVNGCIVLDKCFPKNKKIFVRIQLLKAFITREIRIMLIKTMTIN